MKVIHKLYIISAMVFLTVGLGCKKDVQQNITINPPKVYNENADIRVLKVEYEGATGMFDEGKGVFWYHYDELGRLNKVQTEFIWHDGSTLHRDTVDRMTLLYNEGKINLFNHPRHLSTDGTWNWTEFETNGNKVMSIKVLNAVQGPMSYKIEGIIDFLREEQQGRLSSVFMKPTEENQASTYQPVTSIINEYNDLNLPKTSVSIDRDKDTLHFAPFLGLTYDELFPGLRFNFEYREAKGIPNKLKRLINEELTHLNRYGVTNFDEYKIADINIRHPLCENGEGNWLVSFGFPQYYILESKSTHMLSKRTTQIYKTNEFGEWEYVKTTIEDFPYIHDADAKTLEIAGLKIWYEYVENNQY